MKKKSVKKIGKNHKKLTARNQTIQNQVINFKVKSIIH